MPHLPTRRDPSMTNGEFNWLPEGQFLVVVTKFEGPVHREAKPGHDEDHFYRVIFEEVVQGTGRGREATLKINCDSTGDILGGFPGAGRWYMLLDGLNVPEEDSFDTDQILGTPCKISLAPRGQRGFIFITEINPAAPEEIDQGLDYYERWHGEATTAQHAT